MAFQDLNNTADFLKGSGCSFMGGGYKTSFKETHRNSESIGVGLLRSSLANLEKSDP